MRELRAAGRTCATFGRPQGTPTEFRASGEPTGAITAFEQAQCCFDNHIGQLCDGTCFMRTSLVAVK